MSTSNARRELTLSLRAPPRTTLHHTSGDLSCDLSLPVLVSLLLFTLARSHLHLPAEERSKAQCDGPPLRSDGHPGTAIAPPSPPRLVGGADGRGPYFLRRPGARASVLTAVGAPAQWV